MSTLKTIPPTLATPWFGIPMLQAFKKDMLNKITSLQEEYDDLVKLKILTETIYIIFSPIMVRQIIVANADKLIREERQIKIFSKIHGASVLTTEGESWKRQRKILNPAFSARNSENYLRLMQEAISDNFKTKLPSESGKNVLLDVDQFTTKVTMDVILRVLFSLKVSDDKSFQISQAIRQLTAQAMKELYWPIPVPEWLPYPGRGRTVKNKKIINDLLSGQIADRQKADYSQNTKTDLLTMLLLAEDSDAEQNSINSRLTAQEICDNCKTIFYAGHDTSATALTWWLALMAEHPKYAQKIRAEVDDIFNHNNPNRDNLDSLVLLNASIKESMRLYPPAPFLFQRRAKEDIKLDEFVIPKKSLINIPIWHIHRDPRLYKDPDQFYPERFLPDAPKIPKNAFMPFGVGSRICIGQHFANQEISFIAAMFLKHFIIEFETGYSLPSSTLDLVLKPESPIKLKFTHR